MAPRLKNKWLWLGLGTWCFLMMAAPEITFAVTGSGCQVTSCNAPTPTCSQRTTYGSDNCGGSCSRTFNNYCQAPSPTCSQPKTTGTYVCGGTCTRKFNNYCQASTPSCGQTTSGTYVCGGSCTLTGPACSTQWAPYGFAVPGDPVYGFPAAVNNGGQKVYKDPETMDLLGLAARGNIVIGDYTSADFQTKVLPNLSDDPTFSKTQGYAIDSSDEDNGYWTGDGGFMFDSQKRKLFDGNYAQEDGDAKLDGSPRRFYESTLSDADFQALIDPSDDLYSGTDATIDGVLFTNHALAGHIGAETLWLNGSIVARDESFVTNMKVALSHDIRLLGYQSIDLVLPVAIITPTLVSWESCQPTGCPTATAP